MASSIDHRRSLRLRKLTSTARLQKQLSQATADLKATQLELNAFKGIARQIWDECQRTRSATIVKGTVMDLLSQLDFLSDATDSISEALAVDTRPANVIDSRSRASTVTKFFESAFQNQESNPVLRMLSILRETQLSGPLQLNIAYEGALVAVKSRGSALVTAYFVLDNLYSSKFGARMFRFSGVRSFRQFERAVGDVGVEEEGFREAVGRDVKDVFLLPYNDTVCVPEKPKNAFSFSGADAAASSGVDAMSPKSATFNFDLIWADGQHLSLQARTEDDRFEWMRAIKAATTPSLSLPGAGEQQALDMTRLTPSLVIFSSEMMLEEERDRDLEEKIAREFALSSPADDAEEAETCSRVFAVLEVVPDEQLRLTQSGASGPRRIGRFACLANKSVWTEAKRLQQDGQQSVPCDILLSIPVLYDMDSPALCTTVSRGAGSALSITISSPRPGSIERDRARLWAPSAPLFGQWMINMSSILSQARLKPLLMTPVDLAAETVADTLARIEDDLAHSKTAEDRLLQRLTELSLVEQYRGHVRAVEVLSQETDELKNHALALAKLLGLPSPTISDEDDHRVDALGNKTLGVVHEASKSRGGRKGAQLASAAAEADEEEEKQADDEEEADTAAVSRDLSAIASKQGIVVHKIPYDSKVVNRKQLRWVRFSSTYRCIEWGKPQTKRDPDSLAARIASKVPLAPKSPTSDSESHATNSIDVDDVYQVLAGIKTSALRHRRSSMGRPWRTGPEDQQDCCLSIVAKARTLDLEMNTPEERDVLFQGLTAWVQAWYCKKRDFEIAQEREGRRSRAPSTTVAGPGGRKPGGGAAAAAVAAAGAASSAPTSPLGGPSPAGHVSGMSSLAGSASSSRRASAAVDSAGGAASPSGASKAMSSRELINVLLARRENRKDQVWNRQMQMEQLRRQAGVMKVSLADDADFVMEDGSVHTRTVKKEWFDVKEKRKTLNRSRIEYEEKRETIVALGVTLGAVDMIVQGNLTHEKAVDALQRGELDELLGL